MMYTLGRSSLTRFLRRISFFPLKDPIFFELFVKNGNCYLTDTICKNKKLCNGTRGKFHSLILSAECRDNLNFRLSHSKPGDVIDLFESPIGINILLEDPNLIENKNINWKSLSLNSEQIVITVQQCQKKFAQINQFQFKIPTFYVLHLEL